MRYLPFRPLIDWRSLNWDEDNWPDVQTNAGLNVYIDEKETEVTVEAPVPGMDPKNLKVTYHDGMLHIYGSASEKDEERKKGKVIKKWEMASTVDYVTSLPRPIDTRSIAAKIKDGVVTISAKIAEEAKPKEIEVKVG